VTGGESDDIDIETPTENRVSDRLIFDAKAGGKHDTPTDCATHRHEPFGQIQLSTLFC